MVENLTVANFDRAELNGPGGNEIWWNGGAESGKIGAHGWWGRYLTAYDTGFNGGYGIFTNNEIEGEWEDIYASGFNDSGMYLGACQECQARINYATMEDNALGYSGSNSGGSLAIENSIFRHNTSGIAPNSENPGDGPPPQDGECNRVNTRTPQPDARNQLHRNRAVHGHPQQPRRPKTTTSSTPANSSAAAAPWGAGVELPGVYADDVEGNTITDNPSDGVLAFEYPNPFPPVEDTIYFQNCRKQGRGQHVLRQRLARRLILRRRGIRGRLVRQQEVAQQLPQRQLVRRRHLPGGNRRDVGLSEQNHPQPGRRPAVRRIPADAAGRIGSADSGRAARPAGAADDAEPVPRSAEGPAVPVSG